MEDRISRVDDQSRGKFWMVQMKATRISIAIAAIVFAAQAWAWAAAPRAELLWGPGRVACAVSSLWYNTRHAITHERPHHGGVVRGGESGLRRREETGGSVPDLRDGSGGREGGRARPQDRRGGHQQGRHAGPVGGLRAESDLADRGGRESRRDGG